jgi:hypothetical protein
MSGKKAFKPSPYHSTKPVWRVTTAATSLNDFKSVFRHFILPVAGTENITAYFSDLWDGVVFEIKCRNFSFLLLVRHEVAISTVIL